MQTTTVAARDQLIVQHADMVKRIAMKLARRCPQWVTREDLVSAGMVGLVEAAHRYDLTRAEPFGAFAEQRIRGAILDELRRGDLLPRRVRQTARKIATTIRDLEARGQVATDESIAEALGVTPAHYQEHLAPVARFGVDSLDAPATPVPVDPGASPADALARTHFLARVRTILKHAPERDIQILVHYYLEEQTFQQIGDAMGITPSRVCQLLRRTLAKVREAFGADEIDGISLAA